MLRIFTWIWGDKYSEADVAKLARGLQRNINQPFAFTVMCGTPQMADSLARLMGSTSWPKIYESRAETIKDEDRHLIGRGCFVRLRMFDPLWQRDHQGGAAFVGDRLAWIDLDVIPTGFLHPVFDRPEPFVVLQGANASNPCPYNGSLLMIRQGAHPEVWRDFSEEALRAVPRFEFVDDQAWLAHKVPGAAAWQAGKASGVYAFQKPGWPPGEALPADARLVVFPGWRSPEKFAHLDWVREHW